MKMHLALIAACAGTLVLAQANGAQATGQPIPGINIIVNKCTTNCPKAAPRPPSQGRSAVKQKTPVPNSPASAR
jgi:3-oxoacyl-(acyl-carrier-protein) synthase